MSDRAARSGPTARAVGLTVAAWTVVLVCVVLGVWQWNSGNVVISSPPAQRPVVAVTEVVTAGAAAGSDQAQLTSDEVGRRVEVTGEFDPSVDLLVPRRPVDGQQGSWVLGVVVLPDGTGMPVVRGWLPEGEAAPALPEGPVDLSGVVQPPEGTDLAPSTSALPEGQTWIVSAADLVNRVAYPVANAYVTVTDPAAAGWPELTAVPAQDPGQATRRLDWRNLAYAAQWWVFAAFALVVWVRALRDDRAAGEAAGEAAGDAPVSEERPGGDSPATTGQDRGARPADGPGGRDMSGTR